MARASEARRHVQEVKPLWLVGVTDRPLPVAACNPVIEGPLFAGAQNGTRALDARLRSLRAPTLIRWLTLCIWVGYCRCIVKNCICV